MSYSPGDKIFAKVKGHPHWPSRINRLPPDVPIPKGKYPIFFYGTHEVYFLAPKDIFPYEKFKHKFAIQRNKPLFQAGLLEIEEDPDVLLYGKDPQSEAFLARFYKFTPSGTAPQPAPPPHQQQPQQEPKAPSQGEQKPPQSNQHPQETVVNQAVKRTSTSSLPEPSQPAKRPHIETPPSKSTTPTTSAKKTPAPRSSAKKKATPVKTTPVKTTPVKTTPVETTPVKATPAKATPVKTDPSPDSLKTPARKTPARSTPAPTPPPPPPVQPKPAVPQSPTEAQSTESTEPEPTTRPKRLAALRLRIRKNEDGLTYSPAHDSSLSSLSPSTPESNDTVEAQRPAKESTPPTGPTDPLRITIKQLSTSPSIVTNHTVTTTPSLTLPPKPMFSVTQTPTSLMGVGTNATANSAQKKSTAVVTPLRRDQTPLPPELSDGSAAVSTPSTDGETTPEPRTPKRERSLRRAQRVSRQHHSISERKERRRHGPDSFKSSKTVTTATTTTTTSTTTMKTTTAPATTATTPISEHDSSSTQSPWPTGEYGKNQAESTTNRSAGSTVSSPKLPSHKQPGLEPTSTTAAAHANLDVESAAAQQEQKEQQLKDLDTEARLLLIDRSIKSSLVRNHEDIATCVDRLAVLDHMTISLPILAKCWTVVETIRKCRRYKRSLEVKIAAQKVFNKFLQLYATADKYELDLAHTELMRHQQRYARQQVLQRTSPGQPNATNDEMVIPPYAGPKSMAELFQVSSGTLSERRQPSTTAPPNRLVSSSGSLESSEKSSAMECDSGAAKSRESADSVTPSDGAFQTNPTVDPFPMGFSLSDIPLPEESCSMPRPNLPTSSDIQSTAENGEEEFEVLDEYEEAGEVKTTTNAATPLAPQICTNASSGIIMSGAGDYVPVPLVPYNVVQPPFLSATSYCGVPVDASSAASIGSVGVASVGGFVSPTSQMPPPYPAPYAIPYGYGCLPNSSFTHIMPAASLPIPYTPIAVNAVSTSSGPVTSTSFSYPALPVEASSVCQTTSKAYISHDLHSSTDPPPSSYRTHAPTRRDTDPHTSDQSLLRSPKMSRESRTDNNSISSQKTGTASGRPPIPSPSSPVRRSTGSRHESDRHSRSGRPAPPNRHFRSPPHRARSPHALPHPLEHYQRCLVSALSSDEERSGEVSESGPDAAWSNEVGTKQAHSNLVNTDDLLLRTRDSEDLDTRIARLIGTASRTHPQTKSASIRSDSRKSGNPLGSPPPPPPPPPTSQRILFTHRPPLNSSFTSRTSVPGPSRPVNHRSVHSSGSKDKHRSSTTARRSIPPHTPDSPPARRSSDVDRRLTAFNSAPTESQPSVSSRKSTSSHHPSDSGPHVSHTPGRLPNSDHVINPSEPPHAPVVSRTLDSSGFEAVTTSVPPIRDPSSAPRPNCDEDREIYSMLGV